MSYPPYGGTGYGAPTYPNVAGQTAGTYPAGGYIPGASTYPTGTVPYPSPTPGYSPYPSPGIMYPPASSSPGYPPQSVSPSYLAAAPGYAGSTYSAPSAFPQPAPIYPQSTFSSSSLPYGITPPSLSFSGGPTSLPTIPNYGGAPSGGVPTYPGHVSSYPYSATGTPSMGGYSHSQVYHGTIAAFPSFQPEADAKTLRKAMKGIGTDEKAIIEVIARRSNRQRQEIARTFKTMYGKDLIKELEGELSGDFNEAIMALFTPTTFYDAWSLNKAMRELGTKESVLIEILCSRTNAEIREIVQSYRQNFRRNLEDDIISDTSGHFKRLLVSACQGNRDESPAVNMDLARKEAQDLYQAGERRWGTDESVFNMILAKRHYNQLRATFEEYMRLSGIDVLQSITREFSGDVEAGMKAIVMCARNRPQYFADRLHKAMKGMGTNDSALIRIIVSRSEIDLVEIKQTFFNTYNKSLAQAVHGETSGDYRCLLLALIGN